jgi:23S rRNA (cytidine1920-2'-O)/16S rRNA (cytidine1409-2'-O)-methyltransferase
VLLVKPQFEAGRQEAARGKGVIKDPAIWRRVLDEAMSALTARGAVIMGCMVSPIVGAEGNVEFLVGARVSPGEAADRRDHRLVDLDAVILAARERQDA